MARQKERREDVRRDCLLLCRCEGGGRQFNGYIVDISYGGAGIAGVKELPDEGTEMLVKILLPGKRLELQSRVVWVKSKANAPGLADLGVQFLASRTERLNKLAEFFPKS